MADINVDVNLPSAISVNITSPTQALAANISIPGPQGPRGEKGNPTSINSLTAENIIITGVDGNVAYASGTSTIFISGNSGYFQSAVNTITTNLNNTGANLNTKIDNLSGYVNSQDSNISNNLASTGSSLQSNINTLSSNLSFTGSNLENKINSLSGTLTGNYATIVNLASTGSTLDTKIGLLSGTLTSDYATIINLASTGSSLQNQINSLDNVYATDASVTTVANNLASTGGALEIKIGLLSGTLTSDYATIINLASTGSSLQNQINSLDNVYATDASVTTVANNLASTGGALEIKIGLLSGNLTSNYATINNLALTGSNLNTKIDILSGGSVLKYGDQLISGNKTLSGSFLVGGNGHELAALGVRRIDGISKTLNLRDAIGENAFFVEGDVGTDLLIKMGDVDGADNDAYLSFDQNNALCKIENANLEVKGNIYLSGNPVLTGSSTLYATSVDLASIAFPRGTNKRVYLPAGLTYSQLGGAPATTSANSGVMNLNPYYLPTNMTGSDIILTSRFFSSPFSGPRTTGVLAFGIYDAKSGLQNAALMESFIISNFDGPTAPNVFKQSLSEFYTKGWYITVAARVFSGIEGTGNVFYNALNPQNLHIFGTPSGSVNYNPPTSSIIPNGLSQSAVLSVTGMTYPFPSNFSSIPSSSFVIGQTNPPPIYLMY